MLGISLNISCYCRVMLSRISGGKLKTSSPKSGMEARLRVSEKVQGYKELKQSISTPLACGENEFTRIVFKNWLCDKVVDIIQPNVCQAGGFTECRRIKSMASAWGVSLNPHVWGTAIGLAAALHFLATIPPNPLSIFPNEPLLEFDRSMHPLRSELINNPFTLEQGYVSVANGPGLGIQVKKELVKKYTVI